MSLSVCSISGQPLEHPVASLKTGHLYEKEAIEKHLNSFPYCPITNQPLSHSDLVDIKRTPTIIQPTTALSVDPSNLQSPTLAKSRTSTIAWCWTYSP